VISVDYLSDLLEECFGRVKVLDVLIETRFRLLKRVLVISEQHRVSHDVLLVVAVVLLHETLHHVLQHTSIYITQSLLSTPQMAVTWIGF